MADQSAQPDHPGTASVPDDDAFTITRPDQLHAIGEPTRWRILGRLLDGPASIQELSRSLGMAKGTVGHHVRVLDRAGLIRLVEQHRVRGVVEKRYARVGGKLRLPEEGSELASEHPDVAMLPLRSALAEAKIPSGPGDPSTAVVMRARMPAERARRFAGMVDALAAEFAEGAPGEGEVFGFVGAVYVPDWAGRSEES
jgi:DNA-binding transcriptional ArsR family regulator